MKSRYIVSSLICATALLSACHTDSLNIFSSDNTIMVGTEKQSDAKIVGDLIVLNKNEISAAKEAKMRAMRPEVKKYASLLYTHHTANLQQTLNVGRKLKLTPEMDHTATRMQHDGEQEMTQLRTVSSQDFDSVYINDMIRDHQMALRIIDRDLNSTMNPMLKSHLQKTRQSVQMHLEKAEGLRR